MKKPVFIITVLLAAFAISSISANAQDKEKPKEHPTGYTDTPLLPDGKWRVHDDARPRPEVVTPGDTSASAPSDAIVLFDGKDMTREWVMEKDDSPCDWIVKDGYVEVPP